MGIEPENYVNLTSFTHHPFYEDFPLELADNWQWTYSKNMPLDELMRALDYALEQGYTVCWAADVSEGGFKWKKGYALLPAAKGEGDMTDTELSRWVKLSDKDREEERFDIKGPVKEEEVTQESRQEGFDNFETTDDHGMVIVGVATDQEGNKYYKVKNSWDTNQIYDGFLYASVPYVKAKTIGLGIHKDAVPSDILKKFRK